MGKAGTIYSVTEKVSVDTFRQEWETLQESCFSSEELLELEQRPMQTRAGMYAVKKALVTLYTSLFKAENITPNSFVVLHRKNGAPFLKKASKIPGSFPQYSKKDIHISFSHNRENAYGLVAIKEKLHG
jgi:phosphopantetheinyl transferase (holo-ACP synthase)